MRQLIKYFSKKEYADMFVSGKLYMNALSYFWENGFEQQRDVFEGISDTIKKEGIGLPVDFQQIVSGDLMFRLEAYRYCNLYCFYRVDISDDMVWNPQTASVFPDTRIIRLPDKEMKQFGNYVGVIKKEEEFLKRVLHAVETNWLCVAGDVRYRKRVGAREPLKHSMEMGTKELYPAAHWMRNGANRTSSKDCFDKTLSYEQQKEWRICLFRNQKDDQPYILEVGDLSDIVEIVSADTIRQYLMNLYAPCIPGEVLPQRNAFTGNVTRQQFKEKLYDFDGGMGKLMLVIG